MATHRDELIRSVFELGRDLTWFRNLAPNLRELGVDAATMTALREAWNQQEENRDWVRWQNEAKRFSNAVLDDMRIDRVDQLDMLGMSQWQRDKAASERFQQILRGVPNAEKEREDRSHDQGREM